MEVNGSTLMPIGKYKGQPLEAVVLDRQYCSWLVLQDWAREKHQKIVEFLYNGEQEHQTTPEHNRIQAAFLDNTHCARVVRAAYPNLDFDGSIANRKFETNGFDVAFCVGDVQKFRREYNSVGMQSIIAIELKPSISDDYPRVIRQINTAKRIMSSTVVETLITRMAVPSQAMSKARTILVNFVENHIYPIAYCESASSVHLSEHQIKQIFRDSGIVLVIAKSNGLST